MKLAFFTRDMGAYSEVWCWKQFQKISAFKKDLYVWNYVNRETFPVDAEGIADFQGFDPAPYERKMTKWLYRLSKVMSGNFYDSTATEKASIKKSMKRLGKPDVVLAQFGFWGVRIARLCKEQKIPLVVHFHGIDLPIGFPNKWYRKSLERSLSYFSACVVVGSHQVEVLKTFGVAENKIHLIPCGVDVLQYKHAVHVEKNVIDFICVSRLVEKKGLSYTIEAFVLVRQSMPCKLHIYGDGPLFSQLKEQAEKSGFSGDIVFHGVASPDKVKEALANSDVFLQHSIPAINGDVEGFGVSVSEASSSGLPVVCSDSFGIRDQVVDGVTGFLVPCKNANAMSEKMILLANDYQLRSQMGRNGFKHMKENYDLPGQIFKLEKVLLDCVNNK
jgi:colanic acid/amylovoran biosynthesis glycosyltransferase